MDKPCIIIFIEVARIFELPEFSIAEQITERAESISKNALKWTQRHETVDVVRG
jgi:hypothetical protein